MKIGDVMFCCESFAEFLLNKVCVSAYTNIKRHIGSEIALGRTVESPSGAVVEIAVASPTASNTHILGINIYIQNKHFRT